MRFSDLWTEKDGDALDIKRVLMIPIGVLAPPALQVAAMFRGGKFEALDFCTGYAAIISALAVLLAAHAMAHGENVGEPNK